MNASTSNPLIFLEYNDEGFEKDIFLNNGNIHSEYPSKVLDYLCIALSELGSISERRIERLVNPALSHLPDFLVKEGGLNNGFMIAHCTASSLVSENKTLSYPASVDSKTIY